MSKYIDLMEDIHAKKRDFLHTYAGDPNVVVIHPRHLAEAVIDADNAGVFLAVGKQQAFSRVQGLRIIEDIRQDEGVVSVGVLA